MEPGAMIDVSPDETTLLVGGGIPPLVARPWRCGVVVVVRPFVEVVGELEATRVGACILKVDDDELLVLVGRLKKR